MSSNQAVYKVELVIEGPFATKGLQAAAFGLDYAVLRDRDDFPIIPGSLLKGVISHILRQVAYLEKSNMTEVDYLTWFGAEASNPAADETDLRGALADREAWVPKRGIVNFSDLKADSKGRVGQIARIAVDEATGSAEEGALQVLEAPFAVGQSITFTGTVRIAADDAAAQNIVSWFKKAMSAVPSLGAFKTSGFGRILGYQFSPAVGAAKKVNNDLTELRQSSEVGLYLNFSEPFLVDAGSLIGNVFTGGVNVSGAVIKGALAHAIGSSNDAALAGALSKVIFCEARPVKRTTDQRPGAIPLSIYGVWNSDGSFEALFNALRYEPDDWGAYVAFQADWKWDSNDPAATEVRALYHHTFVPSYCVRTRTAIDKTKGTASEGKLFSQLLIDPAGYMWKGRLLQGAATDQEFQGIMQALVTATLFIGKTKAIADVTLMEVPAPPTVVPLRSEGGNTTWRVILETDALLHDSQALVTGGSDQTSEQALQQHYQKYWSDTLGCPDVAVRFYATQKWAGGYIARRYPSVADGYYPYLLTNSGSVFEITTSHDLSQKLGTLARRGLPLPKSVPAERRSWQTCPYVAENGFGEVRVDAASLTADDKGAIQC